MSALIPKIRLFRVTADVDGSDIETEFIFKNFVSPNEVKSLYNANQIQKIASISRVGRDSSQELFGFQRSQIGNHIQEIHDYLEKDDSVLPNAIILAFTKGVELKLNEDKKSAEILIDLEDQPIGLIVDGQQRFSALMMLENKNFEVFVSAIICKDED